MVHIPSGVRILIADDNAGNRQLVRAILSACDVTLVEADSGEAAVSLSSGERFDAILMDLRMPGLDGVGATRRIRESGGLNAQTPILAFSADLIRFGEETLFDDLISKPATPAGLIHSLSRAIAAHRRLTGAAA